MWLCWFITKIPRMTQSYESYSYNPPITKESKGLGTMSSSTSILKKAEQSASCLTTHHRLGIGIDIENKQTVRGRFSQTKSYSNTENDRNHLTKINIK